MTSSSTGCSSAQKRGWRTCPSKSVPAGEIEQFVVDRIKCIGRDPSLVSATVAAVSAERTAQVADLKNELHGLNGDIARWNAELRTLVKKRTSDTDSQFVTKLADYQERIRQTERRKNEIDIQIGVLEQGIVDEYEVETTLAEFEPLWNALTPREQVRIVQMLIERVDYDGGTGKIVIRFQPTGIKTLANEIAHQREQSA